MLEIVTRPAQIVFSIDAKGSVGAVGAVYALAPTFSLEGAFGGTANLSVPQFRADALGEVGSVGILNVTLRRFGLSATGSFDEVGRAALVVPSFISVSGILDGTVPAFGVRAMASDVIEALYRAYAVNVNNAGLTEYTNFPFNHIVTFGRDTIAFTDSGAFILGGDLDDDAPIDAEFNIPAQDFGSSVLKRLGFIYLGVKSNAALKVSAIADERLVVASSTTTNGRTRRAKMAKGVKARFWGVKVQNQNGEDFAVDSVELLPMTLRRKV